MNASPRCRVDRLRLFNVRNYADEEVVLGPALNLLVGANAQGKTNLLEAVATVALTRSPRATTAAEMIAWGAQECRIDAAVHTATGPTTIDLRLRRGAGAAAVVRSVRIDGTPRGARAVLGLCPIVLFWPEDLLLVRAGPEGRRRLLDTVLSQLDQRCAADLVRYRRILEQRNALLRRARAGSGSLEGLSGFTEALAEHGGAIRVARQRLVRDLAPMAAEALRELSGGRERLDLRYRAGADDDDGTDGAGRFDLSDGEVADPMQESPSGRDRAGRIAGEQLAGELAARRAEELARGVTVAGPHRDDVEIVLDGHAARAAASQGQQRSIVLAIKLAEVRHINGVMGVAPVLVLDDVLSELDGHRRQRLLTLLGAGRNSQALVTTSEPGIMAQAEGVELLNVAGGHVQRGVRTELAS